MGRKISNPKREIQIGKIDKAKTDFLLKSVRYVGSPYHKNRRCKDYKFKPLTRHTDGALCDEDRVICLQDAERLLKLGIGQGLISGRKAGDFPKNIWCVDEGGKVWEAQGDSNGHYHGYLLADDVARDVVLREWESKKS